MNKSWRLTAVFGVLLLVCGAIYFFASPPATTPMEKLDPRVLEITAEGVTKIEIDRKGSQLAFERARDPVGEHWRMVGPISHAADSNMVQQMLFGLDRFVKAGAMEPGTAATTTEITGLNEPRLSVVFTSSGRRDVLKFGKSPMTNTTAVFYQHEGDPKIYLVSVDTFDAFNKPVFQYRAKQLTRFQPHTVKRLELDFKFLRAKEKGKPPVAEYEHSVIERFEEGMERGWYLTQPHKERLDDHKVAALVTELAGLQAGEYQPPGDPKEQGFDEPELRVAMTCHNSEKPVTVHFGGVSENGKKRWVRVPESGEVALYDGFRYDELPRRRNDFRNSVLFPFTLELARKVELEVKDLGRIVLERRETKKEGEPVGILKWQVVEPADLKVESERVEAFAGTIVSQNITGFLGEQDFKLAGLDPAPIRLTVTTKEGKTHACGFATGSQGYLRKDGVNELFEVRADFVRMLQRLELNFINMEIFNVPRDTLRGFAFESRVTAQLQPVYYKMEGEPGKAWRFIDPAHQGKDADPDRVGGILATMNFIKAEALIGRDDKTIEKYRLNESTAPATLKIHYLTGDRENRKPAAAELYISDDVGNMVGRPMYYARLSDTKTVFQIPAIFVESLKAVPEKKKDEGGEKKEK